MIKFSKNKIATGAEIIGEELKEARQRLKIKIKEAARELKISAKHLEALENNRFDKLPAGVYVKNFIREYAFYLKLEPDKLIEIFNNEVSLNRKYDQKSLFSKRAGLSIYFFSIPKILKNLAIISSVLVCACYLGFCMKKIISPPSLSIINPGDNLITEERYVDIKGLTDPEAEIVINGELILKNGSGFFEKKVNLKDGLNIISITAQKKYSQKNNITKKILVKG